MKPRPDSFDHADRRVKQLLDTLNGEQNVCGCCVARALIENGSELMTLVMGSQYTADMLEDAACSARQLKLPNGTPAGG
jgi:hypothetical protein